MPNAKSTRKEIYLFQFCPNNLNFSLSHEFTSESLRLVLKMRKSWQRLSLRLCDWGWVDLVKNGFMSSSWDEHEALRLLLLLRSFVLPIANDPCTIIFQALPISTHFWCPFSPKKTQKYKIPSAQEYKMLMIIYRSLEWPEILGKFEMPTFETALWRPWCAMCIAVEYCYFILIWRVVTAQFKSPSSRANAG